VDTWQRWFRPRRTPDIDIGMSRMVPSGAALIQWGDPPANKWIHGATHKRLGVRKQKVINPAGDTQQPALVTGLGVAVMAFYNRCRNPYRIRVIQPLRVQPNATEWLCGKLLTPTRFSIEKRNPLKINNIG
jgi:hypothetical protein